MNKYIDILKKLNLKAIQNGDVPVSAIIICDDKIISKAYNKKEKLNNPLYHAEIIAINKACKKMNSWNLNGCILITTLKPCDMCIEIIKSARINKIYYILDNKKVINSKLECIKYDTNYYSYFLNEIKGFFKDKR